VELALDVPGRARPVSVSEGADAQPAQHDATFVDGRTQLRWRRPHLPRSTAWTVAAEVPASALAASLREQARPRVRAPRRASASPWPTLLGAAFGVLLLGGLTARARTAALARLGLRPRPLVALSHRARVLGVVTLVAAAPLVASAHPALAVLPLTGLVALLLVAGAEPTQPVSGPRASQRAASHADLRAALRASRRERWLRTDALFDATTAPGAVLVLVGAVLVARLTALAPPLAAPIVPLASLLAGVPLFVLTRRARALSHADALLGLARLARTLRAAPDAPCALALLVSAADGAAVAPQLRVVPPAAPDGLVTLGFAYAGRTIGLVTRPAPVLAVVVRGGSDADRALDPLVDALTLSRTSEAAEVTRLLPPSALDEVLRALADAHAIAESLLDADALHDDGELTALLFTDDVREDSRSSPSRSFDRVWAG
jgi:hypothetical protein